MNGILTAPALAAAAIAPFVGAALAQVLGSYADAFLVLAAVAGVAAVLMAGATPQDRPAQQDVTAEPGAISELR